MTGNSETLEDKHTSLKETLQHHGERTWELASTEQWQKTTPYETDDGGHENRTGQLEKHRIR